MNKPDVFMKGDFKVCFMDTRLMGSSGKWRPACTKEMKFIFLLFFFISLIACSVPYVYFKF